MQTTLEKLNRLNESLPILDVGREEFNKYGRVLDSYNSSELINYMKQTPIPQNENIYIASDEDMNKIPIIRDLEKNYMVEWKFRPVIVMERTVI